MERGFVSLGPICRRAALVFALLATAVCAQQAGSAGDKLEEELRYVDGLQKLYLMDLADEVMAVVEREYPEAKAKLAVRRIRGELGTGQFDAVKQRIAAMKDQDGAEAWAMKLALADAYYAYTNN